MDEISTLGAAQRTDAPIAVRTVAENRWTDAVCKTDAPADVRSVVAQFEDRSRGTYMG